MAQIPDEEIELLREQFKPLIGLKIDWLSLPEQALDGFEPSQIAVIINTLLDAALPQMELLASNPENQEKLEQLGLSKALGEIGQREGYPDYIHISGKRIELKGLFIDNPNLPLKRPPTPREPSARIKENITIETINPREDVLLVLAVRLDLYDGRCYPVIIDFEIFPMIECIQARDRRLIASGGRWKDGVPQVVSKQGRRKLKAGEPLTDRDYEKDTNFGKLKRIPYPPLQEFMRKHGAIR